MLPSFKKCADAHAGNYDPHVSIFASHLARLSRKYPDGSYERNDALVIAILRRLVKVTDKRDAQFWHELQRRFQNPSPLDHAAEPIYAKLAFLADLVSEISFYREFFTFEKVARQVPSLKSHHKQDPFSIPQLRDFLAVYLPKNTPLPDDRTISRQGKAAGLKIRARGWR